MIKFILMINKQGQTRLSQYYESYTLEEKCSLESELIRKCLCRDETQCSFIHIRDMSIVYRRYASLYLIIGACADENELAILELIQNIVETMDRYFESVCELDIMFNLEKAHFILNEMVINGKIVDTNKTNVLYPISLYDCTNKNG
ncbi:clathrin coat assembly protein, putative [Theileria equi strain WA]|uniref:AP complex subunit sigma n=1 Tax=Theileria equi strain WA TaxID=1537102 RepID=L1LEV2_THEEQ|nr:clathrin coat assembly protein, putative [Theileria equi strain WA]EKX73799.1 clathrin coat assembly protein, putative [Theileria equi strain WA]|eukprot:XP_004833251.1 clathrin coat assembly protein, putative [Theileria equi strain WA]